MSKIFNNIKNASLLFLFKFAGAIFPKYIAMVAFSLFTKPKRHYPRESDNVLISQAVDVYEQFEYDVIAGYRFGDGDKLVMLVHGWSSHALSMRGFIPELLKNGYSVLTFDAPGHGKSTGSHLDVMKYIGFLQHVFKKYNPYGVIGHSIGGNCVLFAIAKSNLGASITKQVIIGAPVGAIAPIKQFIHHTRLNKRAVVEFYNIIYKIANDDHTALSFTTAYPEGLNLSSLIIHDANDSIVSLKNGQAIHSTLPNSELFITHNLGHVDILKSPLVIKKVIDYLLI
jgi:pimeloyl-ACP methyl ester carboxylesterase